VADVPGTILGVDAEQDALDALALALESLDVEVLTATSGPEGIDILKAREIDVVVSDMRIPSMNGPEFLREAALMQPCCRRIVVAENDDVEGAKAAINEGGVSFYLNKPWNDDELRRIVGEELSLARLARENSALNDLTQEQNQELQHLNGVLEERVAQRTEELEHTNGVLQTTLEELERTHEHMVDLVANIAAMPNPECENARRKQRLALAIAEELELDEESLMHLRDAARLHRLGWVGISPDIVALPLAKMSETQRAEFERHPEYAEAVMMSVPRLKSVGEIVRSQHEAWNGEGFPERSVGEGIPLGARILAVSRDYYDLLAGHVEDEQMTPAKAFKYIIDRAETEYDPTVVRAFRAALATVDDVDPNLDEMLVKTMSLLPSMRLARDLTTDEGIVLLAKGSTLTDAAIGTLLNLERRSDRNLNIFVMTDSIPEPTADG
jgi:response regulator RpfG family c-di-GMP phosphodiesterase